MSTKLSLRHLCSLKYLIITVWAVIVISCGSTSPFAQGEITMDTSKKTKELPMTFPEPGVGFINGLSNHKYSSANR